MPVTARFVVHSHAIAMMKPDSTIHCSESVKEGL